jgi:hypothetical protein
MSRNKAALRSILLQVTLVYKTQRVHISATIIPA